MALGEEIEKKPPQTQIGQPAHQHPLTLSLPSLSPHARPPSHGAPPPPPPRSLRPEPTPPRPAPPRPSRGPLGVGASKPCPARAPLWPAVGHRIQWQDEADPWRTSTAAAAAEASGGRRRLLFPSIRPCSSSSPQPSTPRRSRSNYCPAPAVVSIWCFGGSVIDSTCCGGGGILVYWLIAHQLW